MSAPRVIPAYVNAATPSIQPHVAFGVDHDDVQAGAGILIYGTEREIVDRIHRAVDAVIPQQLGPVRVALKHQIESSLGLAE